jgi:hypothetical protein
VSKNIQVTELERFLHSRPRFKYLSTRHSYSKGLSRYEKLIHDRRLASLMTHRGKDTQDSNRKGLHGLKEVWKERARCWLACTSHSLERDRSCWTGIWQQYMTKYLVSLFRFLYSPWSAKSEKFKRNRNRFRPIYVYFVFCFDIYFGDMPFVWTFKYIDSFRATLHAWFADWCCVRARAAIGWTNNKQCSRNDLSSFTIGPSAHM